MIQSSISTNINCKCSSIESYRQDPGQRYNRAGYGSYRRVSASCVTQQNLRRVLFLSKALIFNIRSSCQKLETCNLSKTRLVNLMLDPCGPFVKFVFFQFQAKLSFPFLPWKRKQAYLNHCRINCFQVMLYGWSVVCNLGGLDTSIWN